MLDATRTTQRRSRLWQFPSAMLFHPWHMRSTSRPGTLREQSLVVIFLRSDRRALCRIEDDEATPNRVSRPHRELNDCRWLIPSPQL
jgi:hypothetical protein